jgi:general secretion pathway protein C
MLREARRQADRVADRIPHDAIFAGLELLMLAALAGALARLIWTVATPVGPFGNWVPAARARSAVDIASLGDIDPFFRNTMSDAGPAVSTLGLTLLGTRVDTVSGRGSAIIAGEDGKQSSYGIGETVVPGVILKSVEFDAVVLDRAGVSESLFLDQSAGGSPVTPAAPSRATQATPPAKAVPGNRPRLAADVLVTPRLRGSTITGYVLNPKGSGAAFAAAGLQAGDVLISIDDRPVAELGDPSSLARRLDAGGVVVGLERGASVVKLGIGNAQ